MLLKKGIVRKTFIFSSLLILLVVSLSFAVMYFTMPRFYFMQKEKNLQANLNALVNDLRAASTEAECAELVAGFSDANNANVLSFDKNEVLLPAISTPFLHMDGLGEAVYISRTRPSEAPLHTIRIKTGSALQDNRIGSPSQNARYTVTLAAASGENTISLQGKVGTGIVDHITANSTLQPINEAKGVILSLIPYVLAISIALGLVLAGIYARQISKPILQISDAALRMQRMEPDAVSEIKTNDEVGQLSANLDTLYASLRENIEQLQDEMDKVNRLERSKTEMMQSASHELKTPIAALGGMLEGMIDNVGVYKNKEKYLLECKGQVDKLSGLVAEILDASKYDVTETEILIGEVYADEMIEQAIAENMFLIQENNLVLEKNLPSAKVAADPALLYRIISNLIANAARYTAAGGKISIAINKEETKYRISIENDCEQIPEDELPKLFEPFYTRSSSRDKTASGTGLGLYIVRRSLERLEIPYEAVATGRGLGISFVLDEA